MQRFFDILISGLTLICLSPLLIPISIILKLTGEGEIFYVQQRVGQDGKNFGLLKFATMLKNSPNMGTGDITLRHDPRVLPIGRFLRKTKINELPQIINILKGDMSIVGYRPITPRNFSWYPPEVQAELNKNKPGLTGTGSIFFRDEESIISNSGMDHEECYRTLISPYKGALEIWYIKNRSLWLYFILIFLTAWAIVFKKSDLYKKLLKGLPEPPESLQKLRAEKSI